MSPQPTPGRALTPRPGPASITSRSTVEPLPPAAAAPPRPRSFPGVAAPRLGPRSGGARSAVPLRDGLSPQRPPFPGAAASPPPRGCSRPYRSSESRRGGGSAGAGGSLPAGVSLGTALQPEQPGSTSASPAEPPGSSRGKAALPAARSPLRAPEGTGLSSPASLCLPGGRRGLSWELVEGSHRLLFLAPFSWRAPATFRLSSPPTRAPDLCLALSGPEAFGALYF